MRDYLIELKDMTLEVSSLYPLSSGDVIAVYARGVFVGWVALDGLVNTRFQGELIYGEPDEDVSLVTPALLKEAA